MLHCSPFCSCVLSFVQFVVAQLKDPAALDRKTVQMFERLFLADDDCNYFLDHFGATHPGSPGSQGVDGKYSSLPECGASKYYVGSMNYFGGLGGFDLLVQRLDCRVRCCCHRYCHGCVLITLPHAVG